jgi:hypothetical protein
MATTYSLEQAMARLGVSRNTLSAWCEKCNITPSDHPYEKRVKLLTEDQIAVIRAAMEDARSLRSAHVTQVKAITPPITPAARVPSTPSAPSRAKKQHGAPLPIGWVSLDSLVKELSLDRRTVDRDIADKRIAVSTDGGPWYKPPNDVKTALSPEQQVHFRAFYATRSHPLDSE